MSSPLILGHKVLLIGLLRLLCRNWRAAARLSQGTWDSCVSLVLHCSDDVAWPGFALMCAELWELQQPAQTLYNTAAPQRQRWRLGRKNSSSEHDQVSPLSPGTSAIAQAKGSLSLSPVFVCCC